MDDQLSQSLLRYESTGNLTCQADAVFRADLPIFKGHFPSYPVLPGVYQISLLRFIAGRVLGECVVIVEVRSAKFLRAIRPNELIRIRFSIEQTTAGYDAVGDLSVDESSASHIELNLEPMPPTR